jgi:hypothetical protein
MSEVEEKGTRTVFMLQRFLSAPVREGLSNGKFGR